ARVLPPASLNHPRPPRHGHRPDHTAPTPATATHHTPAPAATNPATNPTTNQPPPSHQQPHPTRTLTSHPPAASRSATGVRLSLRPSAGGPAAGRSVAATVCVLCAQCGAGRSGGRHAGAR